MDDEKLIEECEVTFFVADGPGGQHRNKRETGVRLKHIPTGIVANATERRSQAQNIKVALERLAERIAAKTRIKKPRKPTRPTKASKERRLQEKKTRSSIKNLRGKGEVES